MRSASREGLLGESDTVFAVLLVALGLIGYVGTGSQHVTALIPTWFGVALALFGLLAMSPSESRRKLFMHINVTIGLLGFIGGASEIVRSVLSTKRAVAELQAAGVAGASWPGIVQPELSRSRWPSKLTMTQGYSSSKLIMMLIRLLVPSQQANRQEV